MRQPPVFDESVLSVCLFVLLLVGAEAAGVLLELREDDDAVDEVDDDDAGADEGADEDEGEDAPPETGVSGSLVRRHPPREPLSLGSGRVMPPLVEPLSSGNSSRVRRRRNGGGPGSFEPLPRGLSSPSDGDEDDEEPEEEAGYRLPSPRATITGLSSASLPSETRR